MRGRPRRRRATLLLAAAAVVGVSAVPLANPADDAVLDGALKALEDGGFELWRAYYRQLQLPLACLPRTFMVDETSLSLDQIAELAGSPACAEAAPAGARAPSESMQRYAFSRVRRARAPVLGHRKTFSFMDLPSPSRI